MALRYVVKVEVDVILPELLSEVTLIEVDFLNAMTVDDDLGFEENYLGPRQLDSVLQAGESGGND